MSEISWIKLAADVFDNRKIRQIEVMPEGDTIIVIWFKLLTLAGRTNDGGRIYFMQDMPYTEEMLAAAFNRPLMTIKLALRIFQQYHMIEIEDDIIMLPGWEEYQNIQGLERARELARLRKQKQRANQKLLSGGEDGHAMSRDMSRNVTPLDKDIDKDIDIKEKDISNDISKKKSRFAPPSVDEVRDYIREHGYIVDADAFCAFYDSNGWKVGRNPMKDWKRALVTWEKRRREQQPKQEQSSPPPARYRRFTDDGF